MVQLQFYGSFNFNGGFDLTETDIKFMLIDEYRRYHITSFEVFKCIVDAYQNTENNNDIEAFFTNFLFQSRIFHNSSILGKERAMFIMAFESELETLNRNNSMITRERATRKIFAEQLSWSRDKQLEFIYDIIMQIKDYVFEHRFEYFQEGVEEPW